MPTQPLTRAITQPLTRKPTDPGLGGGEVATEQFNVTDNGGESFAVTAGDFLVRT